MYLVDLNLRLGEKKKDESRDPSFLYDNPYDNLLSMFVWVLFLHLIDSERHGGHVVRDNRLLLVGSHTDRTRLWSDLLGLVERVLVVHRTVVVQRQRLGSGGLDALQVENHGLSLLRSIDYLDDDLVGGLVKYA